MSVTLICPNLSCGRTVVAPESLRGKIVRCAHCRKPFLVPLRQAPEKVESEKKATDSR